MVFHRQGAFNFLMATPTRSLLIMHKDLGMSSTCQLNWTHQKSKFSSCLEMSIFSWNTSSLLGHSQTRQYQVSHQSGPTCYLVGSLWSAPQACVCTETLHTITQSSFPSNRNCQKAETEREGRMRRRKGKDYTKIPLVGARW